MGLLEDLAAPAPSLRKPTAFQAVLDSLTPDEKQAVLFCVDILRRYQADAVPLNARHISAAWLHAMLVKNGHKVGLTAVKAYITAQGAS